MLDLFFGGGKADHQRGLLGPAAQLFTLGGEQRNQLAEGGAAVGALVEIGAQAGEGVFELLEKVLLVLVLKLEANLVQLF